MRSGTCLKPSYSYLDDENDEIMSNSSGSEYTPDTDNSTDEEVTYLQSKHEKPQSHLHSFSNDEEDYCKREWKHETGKSNTLNCTSVGLKENEKNISSSGYECRAEKIISERTTFSSTINQFNPKISVCFSKNIDGTPQEEICPRKHKVFVVGTTNSNKKRNWDKKYYCMYCEKQFSKLPRHLEQQHAEEPAVVELLATKNDRNKKIIREKIICKLRNMGNHQHNFNVLQRGEGELQVVHRPSGPVDAYKYLPCPTCYGYYSKKELWNHKCSLKEICTSNQRVLSASRSLVPLPAHIDVDVKDILCTMRQDTITHVIKNDNIICEYMRRMFHAKGGIEHHKKAEIRNAVRETGRLLQALREITGKRTCCFQSFLDASLYRTIIHAVKRVSDFREDTKSFDKPELAKKLGLHIKACAVIVQSSALQDNNQTLLERTENFIKLHQLNFRTEVLAQAHRDRKDRIRKKDKFLPLSSDVVKLNNHLSTLSEECRTILGKDEIAKEEIVSAWVTLQKVTLTHILVFNRRREGEVSRMKLSDYNNKKTTNERSDIIQTLTESEKALCKLFTRIEIIGKCDRNVPVLLTNDMKNSFDLLIKWRNVVGVSPENKFLFASCIHGARFHYRGAVCLRKFAVECGAETPESLRSTKLRKNVATISQVLNLKENELDALATFMGHDIRIHREYYRLPDSIQQIAKLSKIFLALDKGCLQKQSGKSLDEIDVITNKNVDVFVDDEKGYSGHNEIYISELTAATENQERKESRQSISKHVMMVSKRMWSKEEICAVEKHLHILILSGKIPGAVAIRKCLNAEPVLSNRSWRNIKDYCRNKISALNRRCNM